MCKGKIERGMDKLGKGRLDLEGSAQHLKLKDGNLTKKVEFKHKRFSFQQHCSQNLRTEEYLWNVPGKSLFAGSCQAWNAVDVSSESRGYVWGTITLRGPLSCPRQ